MSKNYLGQKGYSIYKENLTIKEQEQLRDDLTAKPFVPKNSMTQPKSFLIYRESPNKFYIPRFYGIENYGYPDVDKISKGHDININFNGNLRDFQVPVVETFIKHVKEKHCGLLELYCGYGKTVLALNIIARLKKKTLVIVHKEFLMNQWIERIEQFLPDAKIGKIQGQIVDVDDKDIVIGMLQSISMKTYPQSLFQEFGFSIFDECHHISAEVFSNALFKVVTNYALGLSATMNRKDGLTKVFKQFLGDVVVKKKRTQEDPVKVKAIEFQTKDEEFNEVVYNFKGQTHYAIMIRKLCEFNERREFILKVLCDALKEAKDNDEKMQVMILAHNKSLLTYLYDAITHRKIASVGYYIGGMKEKDLKISEEKQVVIATYAMAEEALDIKTLTTLIMATPKTDVTQAVGRILRMKHANPQVFDIVDSHDIFQRQWQKRNKFYKQNKYNIYYTSNYENQVWETLFEGGKQVKTKKTKKEKSEDFFNTTCLL
jgi:superfamily II DNA or RNA helicase